ncbi:MAG: hypothetical protein ACRDP6_34880 [Actinoallomurus sp.]
MKCPACENDVPSGRTACTRCGASLPSAGEGPAGEPRFSSGSTTGPRAGSPNPTTEPLPVTDWEAADEKPWGASPAPHAPPDPYGAPGPYGAPDPYGASAPYGAPDTNETPNPYGAPDPNGPPNPYGAPDLNETPHPYGAPDPNETPKPYGALEPNETPNPYGGPDPNGPPNPYGGPDPNETPNPHGAPNPYDAPDPFGTPDPYAAPGAGPAPFEPGAATQNLGAPPVHRAPFEPGRPAPAQPPLPPAYPMPSEPDNATQSFGGPGPGTGPGPGFGTGPGTGPIPPGAFDPASWDQGIPPAGGDGTVPPPEDRTGKNTKMPLLAAGVAAVVVLGGGLVYVLAQGLPWSNDATHTATGKPGVKNATQQAAAVNDVLKSGRTARGHLPAPLRTCDDVSAGVSGFQQVVRDRQQELAQSKGLKVDRLQDGPRLRRSMITAYQRSLDADQAYLAWAQEIQTRGCGGKIAPLTAHYKAAITANGKAGPAKRQVVARWNPIATNQGLPTYVWNRL